MTQSLREREAELMRHALGLCEQRRPGRPPYRNHFVAGEDDVDIWDGLVARGLAKLNGRPSICPDPTYFVTSAGKALLGFGRCETCGEDAPLLPGSSTTLARHTESPHKRKPCPGSGKAAAP